MTNQPDSASREKIGRQLLRMNLVSVGLAITLVFLCIIAWEIFNLRNTVTENLIVQATIIGNNSNAALSFGDIKTGEDILSSLKSVPHMLMGKIFDEKGVLFATYLREKEAEKLADVRPSLPLQKTLTIGFRTITVIEPIIRRNEIRGYVQLLYDTSPMYSLLVWLILIFVVFGILTIILTTSLFSKQMKSISDPILHLVETMEIIREDQNYSRRVPVAGPREVASLAERFNELLQTTQEWGLEISSHRNNLEKLVEERTQQWKDAIRKLRTELEERRRAEEELTRKTGELIQARDEANVANHAKSIFVANMSHEIRTPLNAIIGFSDFLMHTELAQKQYDFVKKIQISGNILLGIINDILDFSKIEAGKLEMENLEFELDSVIDDVLAVVSQKAHEKGLELRFDAAADVPDKLTGDPLRVEQILVNLIGNAVKFTEKGLVELRVEVVESRGEKVRIAFTVRDTGVGMSEEHQARIFSPFTQADGSTTRKFGGTGLGLSICKRLSQIMGGEIDIKSRLGQGSSFCFTCWFQVCSADKAARLELPVAFYGMRVLLFCQDPDDQGPILRMLQRFPFMVRQVATRSELLKEIRESDSGNPYKLLILENKSLSAEDATVVAEIKKNQALTNAPGVFILSSFATEKEKKELLTAGVDQILMKPFSASTLFDSLVRLVAPRETHIRGGAQLLATSESALQTRRFLVAEDNAFNQEIARELLEGWGVVVDMVDNGSEAVNRVLSNPPDTYDLVLMDIQMPEMDGFEATRQIRQDSRFAGLPILAMTAHAFSEDRLRILNAGMNDRVTKPIDPHVLHEKLVKYLLPGSLAIHKEKANPHTDSDDFIPITGIDSGSAIKRLRGNVSRYRQLLSRFPEFCQLSIASCQQALDEQALEKIRFQAHTLKGTAANLGVNKVAEIAASLEETAKRDDAACCMDQLIMLRGVVSDISSAIKAMEMPPEIIPALSAAIPGAIARSASEACKPLLQLKIALQEDRFDSGDHFHAIKDEWGAILGIFPEFNALEKHVSQLSFDDALQALDLLLEKLNVS